MKFLHQLIYLHKNWWAATEPLPSLTLTYKPVTETISWEIMIHKNKYNTNLRRLCSRWRGDGGGGSRLQAPDGRGCCDHNYLGGLWSHSARSSCTRFSDDNCLFSSHSGGAKLEDKYQSRSTKVWTCWLGLCTRKEDLRFKDRGLILWMTLVYIHHSGFNAPCTYINMFNFIKILSG